MDLTYLIPYEILQLVSSSLLPKYQCRLAMMSRHHYRYLYNDLLRWHARKAPIEVPRHKQFKHRKKIFSLIEDTKTIKLYEIHNDKALSVSNLTNDTRTTPDFRYYQYKSIENYIINLFINFEGIVEFFNGCYRRMSLKYIKIHAAAKNPLLGLPSDVIYKISSLLPKQDVVSMQSTGIYAYMIINWCHYIHHLSLFD